MCGYRERTGVRERIEEIVLSNGVHGHLDPNGEAVFNISKETTSKELIEVEGVDETVRRMATINYSAGYVNATEIAMTLYGLPSLDQWLDAFLQEA